MGFNKAGLLRALACAGAFAAGIAATASFHFNYYACFALALLIAGWLMLVAQHADPPLLLPPPKAPDGLAHEAALLRLRTMLDHAPVPLLELTPDGALHAMNRAARALFGTDDRILLPSLIQAVIDATPGQRLTVRLPSAQGVERAYALPVAPWTGPQGPGVLAALIDIQPELQAAEAATLRDLLQTLGHEIMNSLTPVMSLAETAAALLAEQADNAVADAQDALAIIARRAQGLERFVTGYRALARVPAAAPQSNSVARLLRDCGILFTTRWRNQGVVLYMQPPEPDIIARFDAALIAQALQALLTNAAEAAIANPARAPLVSLSARLQSDRLVLNVSDSGSGVPAEHAEAIFRPMFTLKPQGTGVGLGLARQIARSHGGELTLEAAPENDGATFLIYL